MPPAPAYGTTPSETRPHNSEPCSSPRKGSSRPVTAAQQYQRVDELRRFRMLMAGVYCAIANSSINLFPVFTEFLRNEYGFNQKDITNISMVGDFFGYFTLPAGFLYDYAGPQAVFPVAGTLGSLGFLILGLTITGNIAPSVVCLAMSNVIFSVGFAALDGASIMTLMLNFPRDTGAMVIIQKTFAGLGTSVLMAYYRAWFPENYSAFAFFIAGHMALCSTIAAIFIHYPPYYLSIRDKQRVPTERQAVLKATQQLYLRQRAPVRRLVIGYVLVGVCLVFLTVQSISMAYGPPANPRPVFIALSVITVALVALFSLMAMPFQCLGRYVPVRPSEIAGVGYATEPLEPVEPVELVTAGSAPAGGKGELEMTEFSAEGVGESSGSEFGRPDGSDSDGKGKADKGCHRTAAGVQHVVSLEHMAMPQYTRSFWRNLLTPELWCMWLLYFGVLGVNGVVINNSAQIYRSINHGEFMDTTNTLYITIMSVGNAIGRVFIGFLDMWLSARQRKGETTVLTTVLLPLPPLLTTVAYLQLAVIPGKYGMLPLFIALIGHGSGWGLFLVCIRKMYARDLGRHYAFCFSAGVLAAVTLNRFLFGELFDREAMRRGTYPTCNDPACVRPALWVFSSVAAVAALAGTAVHFRFSRFTARQHSRRETRAARGYPWKDDSSSTDSSLSWPGASYSPAPCAGRAEIQRRGSEDSIYVGD